MSTNHYYYYYYYHHLIMRTKVSRTTLWFVDEIFRINCFHTSDDLL